MFGLFYFISSLFGAGVAHLRDWSSDRSGEKIGQDMFYKGENPANVWYDHKSCAHDRLTGKKVITYREEGHLIVKEVGGPVLRDVTQNKMDQEMEWKKQNGEKAIRFDILRYVKMRHRIGDESDYKYYDEARQNWDFYIHLPTMKYCLIEEINFAKAWTLDGKFANLLDDDSVKGSAYYFVDIHNHEILDRADGYGIAEHCTGPYRIKEGVDIRFGYKKEDTIPITREEEEKGIKRFMELKCNYKQWRFLKLAEILPMHATHA